MQRAMIDISDGEFMPMISMLVIEDSLNAQKVFQDIFSGSIVMIQSTFFSGAGKRMETPFSSSPWASAAPRRRFR